MWFDELDGKQQGINLKLPYVNASGTLGFSPEAKHAQILGILGAFITNPISYSPRKVATNRAFIKFPGGFLLHSGYPNPGFHKVLRKFKGQWEKASVPIIVHLLPDNPESLSEMVQVLETIENIAAVELSFPHSMPVSQIDDFKNAACGELPLIFSLDHEQASQINMFENDKSDFIVRLAEPYGVLPYKDEGLIRGRIYGPAVFPTALSGVQRLSSLGFKVIGGGGIYTRQQAEAMFKAGAEAVALDALLWCGGINLGLIFDGHSMG